MIKIDSQQIPEALTQSKSRIPALPPGAPFLLRSMTDEDIDFTELAEILEKFPAIAARLIGLANSAWSAPRNTITSLHQACTRMGFDVVRSVSVGLAVAAPFDLKRCQGFSTERFWCSSLLTADTATWIAGTNRTFEEMDVQTARAAGLLHNLGLLWLADRMPDETGTALRACEEDPELSINDALSEHCGVNYCQAGGYLGEIWNLPDALIVSMAYHSDISYHDEMWQSARLIGSAESMVSSLYRGNEWQANPDPENSFPIPEAEQDQILSRTAAKLESTRALARSLFPG